MCIDSTEFIEYFQLYTHIRCHDRDVYLGMCPIKMATPILIYLHASAKLAKRWRRKTIKDYG